MKCTFICHLYKYFGMYFFHTSNLALFFTHSWDQSLESGCRVSCLVVVWSIFQGVKTLAQGPNEDIVTLLSTRCKAGLNQTPSLQYNEIFAPWRTWTLDLWTKSLILDQLSHLGPFRNSSIRDAQWENEQGQEDGEDVSVNRSQLCCGRDPTGTSSPANSDLVESPPHVLLRLSKFPWFTGILIWNTFRYMRSQQLVNLYSASHEQWRAHHPAWGWGGAFSCRFYPRRSGTAMWLDPTVHFIAGGLTVIQCVSASVCYPNALEKLQ